jgi:tetratricopeptide (TPR) repeat protein
MRLLAVMLLAGLPSDARADDPASAQSSISAIATALRDGRAQDADNLATAALNAPDLLPLERADLVLNRGLAREQMQAHASANDDFTSAIVLNVLRPDELARALFDRGVTFDEMGRTADAIKDYSAAIGIMPKFAPALNNRANAYRRSGKLLDARKDYEAALIAGDNAPEFPLYGLGKISEVQGDTLAARGYYRKALAANSQYAPASQRLAALEDDVKRVDFVTPAPEITVDNSAQPANLVLASGDTDAALPLRTSIITSDPPAPRRHVRRQTELASVVAAPDAQPATADGDATKSGAAVQLGAWREQADAANGWNRLMSRAGGLLDGIAPHIVLADVPGKGHYYRLRTDPVSNPAALCDQLKAKGLSCFVARG